MIYRELQKTLKEFKNRGLTNVRLNSKKTVLEQEFKRLTDSKEYCLDRDFINCLKVYISDERKFIKSTIKDGIITDHYMRSKLEYWIDFLNRKLIEKQEKMSLKFIDSLQLSIAEGLPIHDAYMDYKALKKA